MSNTHDRTLRSLHREREAGPSLDRLIELRVFGRKPTGEVRNYSTDEAAAELVIAHLNKQPLRWACVRDADRWTFHWRRPMRRAGAGESDRAKYVKMISSTAATRPLAICLAALKLVDAGAGK